MLGDKLAKMDEAAIIAAYSRYLQQVALLLADCRSGCPEYLSYEDFKDYHILQLVGKGNYLQRRLLSRQGSY